MEVKMLHMWKNYLRLLTSKLELNSSRINSKIYPFSILCKFSLGAWELYWMTQLTNSMRKFSSIALVEVVSIFYIKYRVLKYNILQGGQSLNSLI